MKPPLNDVARRATGRVRQFDMTDNDISRPSQLSKAVADAVLEAARRDPQFREELRAVLLTGEADAWIDQSESQLGRRRHRAAVRAAVEAGDSRARIVGRRHLMRRDLYDATLLAHGRAQVATAAERETAVDDLAAELGLELVG